MALVNYSDSSSSGAESDEGVKPKSKFKRLKMDSDRLPLPKEIVEMKGKKNDQPEENPDDHDGRIRTFQHERGNWATYVYIPVNLYAVEDIQNLFMEALSADLALKKINDIHISLTKTVVLRHHWIDSFVSSVQIDLEAITEFLIEFKKVCVYCNEERTRTFIALQVDARYCSKLEDIVLGLDNILGEFRLDKFYEDPSFHASVLWCIGDHQQAIKQQMSQLQQIMLDFCVRESSDMKMNVNEICCKTGNKHFIFSSRARCRLLPSGVFPHHIS